MFGVKFMLGESYFQFDVFDSFNYIGVSVVFDDQMLLLKLCGYVLEIVGIVCFNVKVKVFWQGCVLYEMQVFVGLFCIQDFNQFVFGMLYVIVEEQNGQIQEFDVNIVLVFFLMCFGMVCYKMVLGCLQDWDYYFIIGIFVLVEVLWGVINGWLFYGGVIGESNYQVVVLGSGKDFGVVGVVVVDIMYFIVYML